MTITRKIQNALKKYYLYRIEKNSYKFFIHKLESEPEVALSLDFFSSEYFKQNLKPMPIDFKKLNKVILFAPHQDDEVIGCGGILSRMKELGIKITLVFLTDGESAQKNQKNIRSSESYHVGELLDADVIEIGISNVDFNIKRADLEKINKVVSAVKPDALFTVWPLDSPFKHRLSNAIISFALRNNKNIDLKIPVYNYQVHTALLPNYYFDYTNLVEMKKNLIGVYKSQLKIQDYTHLSMGLDAWNSRYLPPSKENRYVELFTVIPLEAYLDMIDKFYDKNIHQAFKGNEICIDAYKKMKGM